MQPCEYCHCVASSTGRSKVAKLSLHLKKCWFVRRFRKWDWRLTRMWQTNVRDFQKIGKQLFAVQADQDSEWQLWQEGCSFVHCIRTMHRQLYVQVVPGCTGPPLLPKGRHRQEISAALPLASTTSYPTRINQRGLIYFRKYWMEQHKQNLSSIKVATIKSISLDDIQVVPTDWLFMLLRKINMWPLTGSDVAGTGFAYVGGRSSCINERILTSFSIKGME